MIIIHEVMSRECWWLTDDLALYYTKLLHKRKFISGLNMSFSRY
jgi:hypothetical protein